MEFDREALSSQLIRSYMADEENNNMAVKFLVPLVMLAIVGFITYAWYTDKFAISLTNNKDIPLIRADAEGVRVKPEDPGGMHVANQDKRVYETISNSVNQELPTVTRILPPSEEPVDPSHLSEYSEPTVAELLDDMSELAPAAGSGSLNEGEAMEVAALGKEIQGRGIMGLERGTPDNVIAIDEELLKELIKQEKAKILKKMKEEKAKEKAAQEGGSVLEIPASMDEPKKKVEEKKEEPGASLDKELENVGIASAGNQLKAVTADDIKTPPTPKMRAEIVLEPEEDNSHYYRIQLGSYKNEKDVATNWRRIKVKYGELLEGLDYRIEKADLGEKGVYYRLKAGPFKKDADARKLCQQLREQDQGCLFVRR